MKINDWLRLIAGIMITLSLLLTHLVHPYWVFFTLFVAINLAQSAITKWCPMMSILRKLGVKE